MKNFQRASLACSVSVIAAFCLIAPASAANPTPVSGNGSIERLSSTVPVEVNVDMDSAAASVITAPAAVKLTFSRPAVTTVAAPPPPPPAPVAEEAPQAEAAVDAPVTPASTPATYGAAAQATAPAANQFAQAAAPSAAMAPAVAYEAPATAVSASGKGAAIAAAALSQLGVEQDCTALVSNALRAVGINFHSSPAGYMSLGSVVSAAQAQPGDLIYYANGGGGQAHIAVYIGGGKAVHGGWEGHTTKIFSANVGSGPTFIHLR